MTRKRANCDDLDLAVIGIKIPLEKKSLSPFPSSHPLKGSWVARLGNRRNSGDMDRNQYRDAIGDVTDERGGSRDEPFLRPLEDRQDETSLLHRHPHPSLLPPLKLPFLLSAPRVPSVLRHSLGRGMPLAPRVIESDRPQRVDYL